MRAHTTGQKEVRRRRRWKVAVGANVFLAVALATVLVVLVNGFASLYYWRLDVGRAARHPLSHTTERLLDGLQNTVEVFVFFRRGAPLHDVEILLRQFQDRAPRLRVEYVDPDRNLARAEELIRRHDVTEPNVVVVRSRDRSEVLAMETIRESAPPGIGGGAGDAGHTRFRGEQAFAAAIYRVTTDDMPTVYFLAGHGERSIDNFDQYVGYSSIAKRLRQEHIKPDTLVLGETDAVPDDGDVLIIAGPNRRISQPELDLISEYLEQSGRAMVLLDSMTRTGLEPILRRWGVLLGDDVVIDADRSLSGRELFVTQYGEHPITAPVQGLTSIFYSPRSVTPLAERFERAAEEADKPQVTVLASSSQSGWASRTPGRAPLRFDPEIDLAGPVPVAVAVERGPVRGIDVQIRPTRLVVFGDSGFASNGALTGGDEDFFMSALHWLLEREERMEIEPRHVAEARLLLNRRQIRRLLGWTVGGLPAAVAILGVLMALNRRR